MSDVLDMFKLDGKLAVITGAAGLLGQQHAAALLEAGCQVVMIDNNQKALDAAVSTFAISYPQRVWGFKCDITIESEVVFVRESTLAKVGRDPDVLVNNAAIDPKFSNNQTDRPQSRVENYPIESWNRELSVGLLGSFLCAKVFGSQMAKQKKGVIINVASDLGLIAPNQSLYSIESCPPDRQPVKPVTYSVVKHGLIGLTKYLATYWADSGVRCNAIAPGGAFNGHSDEFVHRISKLIPMGRMANVSEYKAAMVFLASEASSYMTGAVLTIDGGRSTW
jgi:NAD(P)-dependent dehydrogenase (short-subunit alcohol dehydrogenase family)